MSTSLFLRLLLPFAYGYYLSYIVRSVNAVIATELQVDLSLDANQLGLLTSLFFLSFALMQIPLGIMMDRYGPRKVEGVLMLFSALGCYMFAVSDEFYLLGIGRLLIGIGMSACLMASFTTINHWFDKTKVPSMNAIIMTAGGLGAISATDPIIMISGEYGWRAVFHILAVASLICSALMFFVVPHRDSPAAGESIATAINGLKRVFTSRYFWIVTSMTMLSQATFGSIYGLWTGPWFRDVAGLDQAQTGVMLRWFAIAMTLGFLTIGNLASLFAKRGLEFWKITFGFMLIFLLVQPILLLPYGWWSVLGWLLFGFFGTSGILAYPLLTQRFDSALAGRVNASLNLLVFVCSFAMQWGIGAIIKLWPASSLGFYPQVSYRWAFLVVLVLQLITMAYFWSHRDRLQAAES